jgi:hypothetical protein
MFTATLEVWMFTVGSAMEGRKRVVLFKAVNSDANRAKRICAEFGEANRAIIAAMSKASCPAHVMLTYRECVDVMDLMDRI